MSTLRKWLQSNQIFDKDLLQLLPKYNVNDPEKDLKNLTKSQWTKIKNKITIDNGAKLRSQKRLDEFEKLWRLKRPKRKPSQPKLLKVFDNAENKDKNAIHSPPKKKKKSKKSKGLKSPTKSNTNTAINNSEQLVVGDEETWDRYDDLNLSENEEDVVSKDDCAFVVPMLPKNASVVDALLIAANSAEQNEWNQYDRLNLSDDEEEVENEKSATLLIPKFQLKVTVFVGRIRMYVRCVFVCLCLDCGFCGGFADGWTV